jgi:Family of unknown function (DUF5996)
MTATEAWPPLDYAEIRPTVDHLHRLAHIAGKYTLDQPFEPNWGSSLLPITPRGFATPMLRSGELMFALDYELLDDRLTISASTGRASLPLAPGSVSGFLERFLATAEPLGLPRLRTLSEPEIPGGPALDQDDEERPYDPAVARRIWAALAHTSAALTEWQAPYRGHRPRVGLMWGGFDLAATRYNGRPLAPPHDRPVFQQNGMTEEVVAVGLAFGDEWHGPHPCLYAYIAPPPQGLESADLGAAGATWDPDAGIIRLSWNAVRQSADPHGTVIAFADAVYAAAVDLAGWPADLVGPRWDGWHAAREPVFGVAG